jgi:hypothetical protein
MDEALLHRLFERIGPDMPLGLRHDISQEPAVKFLAKHFVQLDNGEKAIALDLEVLDEQALTGMGGFSISYTRLSHRYGIGELQLRVLINPRQFDIEEVCEIVRESRPADCFDVTELIQKADVLVIAVISIVVYAVMGVADGFFNAAGANLYETIRRLRRKDAPRGPTVIQFHLNLPLGARTPQLILVAPPGVPSSAIRCISSAAIAELLSGLPAGQVPERIVVTVLPDGKLRLDRVIGVGRR